MITDWNNNNCGRIVITGLGLVTALGCNVRETWENICAGKHGITEITAWDTSQYHNKIAAEVKYQLTHLIKQLNYIGNDRCHQLALIACYEGLKDAFEDLTPLRKERIGVIVGTSLAGMVSMQEYDRLIAQGKHGSIESLHNQPMHVCADVIASEFNFTGPRSVISTACTASTLAIAKAALLIRSNQADAVLVCGCDPLSYFSYSGFSSMKNVAPIPCSPFSENTGLSLGEGAGVLILEKQERAEKRQARIYAEFMDYALSCDAYHPTSPDPTSKSQLKLIKQISKRSYIKLEEIEYINAHGTGTAGNDITESIGIELAFSEKENHIVSSIKGALGHTLGAAGAIEAVLTVKSIEQNIIPPTVNFTKPRKNCRLNYAPNVMINKPINYAITQNFAFGGNNAALLLGKYNKKNHDQKNYDLQKRVVITGFGMITPLGISCADIGSKISVGQTGIQFHESNNCWYQCGLLNEFNYKDYVPYNLRRADRFGQMIVSAAYLSLNHAGLTINKENTERIGIVLGTSNGHVSSNLEFHREIVLKGPAKVNPIIFPNTVLNAGVGLASIHLQLKGCSVALSMGEMSGALALSYGYDLIKDNAADIIIAGGADEINNYLLDCFYKAGITRRYKNKNGTKLKDKMILGEGACFVILESFDSAINRGAKIYSEIMGYCSSGMSYFNSGSEFIVSIENGMKKALLKSNTQPNRVQSVSVSGTRYKNHSYHESEAIKKLFGPSINKFNFHEQFGTSSATDVAGLCLMIHEGKTHNYCINSSSIGGAHMSLHLSNENLGSLCI